MNQRTIGAKHENVAAEYLKKEGYTILERNYRCRYGEIDLIAKKGNLLVIVEVKYRSKGSCGDPTEAVDGYKQKKICRVTLDYLMRNPYFHGKQCRFDVIAIYGNGKVRHIKNAFCYQ